MNSMTQANFGDGVIFIDFTASEKNTITDGATDSLIFTPPQRSLLVERSDTNENPILIKKWKLLKKDLADVESGLLPLCKFHKRWHSEYVSWKGMRYNRTVPNGKYLRSVEFDHFDSFIRILGPKLNDTYTLDRRDNDLDYTIDNCRWLDKPGQTANRTVTRRFTDNHGTCLTPEEWFQHPPHVKPGTSKRRVDRDGWSEHDAVHVPTGQRRKIAPSTVYTPPNADKFVAIFEQITKNTYGETFVPITPTDRKHLKEIAGYLVKGGIDAEKAIEYALENWLDFMSYWVRKYGGYTPTLVPTVRQMYQSLTAIGNFYIDEQKDRAIEKEEAEESARASALLQEKKRIAAETERLKSEKKQFIDNFIISDEEYQETENECAELERGKNDLPNWGVTDDEFDLFKSNCTEDYYQTPSIMLLWKIKKEKAEEHRNQARLNANQRAEKAWQHEQIR